MPKKSVQMNLDGEPARIQNYTSQHQLVSLPAVKLYARLKDDERNMSKKYRQTRLRVASVAKKLPSTKE